MRNEPGLHQYYIVNQKTTEHLWPLREWIYTFWDSENNNIETVMPKKSAQTTEANSNVLSREDRKNEQIMRMIERAEKQRQKREEKKIKAVSRVPCLTISNHLTFHVHT